MGAAWTECFNRDLGGASTMDRSRIIVSACLSPPDVWSQLLLGIP